MALFAALRGMIRPSATPRRGPRRFPGRRPPARSLAVIPLEERVLLSYTFTTIADTTRGFDDFSPYVASLNSEGTVAFQASLKGGGSGIFTGTGGRITTI